MINPYYVKLLVTIRCRYLAYHAGELMYGYLECYCFHIRPIPPFNSLHGPHCLNHDFTWLAKPAVGKQTSQLSLLMQQCTGSALVWLLAGGNKMQLAKCDNLVGFLISSYIHTCIYMTHIITYSIAQNSGGVKLWQIDCFRVYNYW